MKKSLFYRLGALIYRLRWLVILFWLAVLLACIPLLPNIFTPFKSTGFIDEHSTSAKVDELLRKRLDYKNNNRFIVVYSSDTLSTKNSLFDDKIKESLVDLKKFPLKHVIFYPNKNKKQISKDKHTAYVAIQIDTQEKMSDALFNQFIQSIKTPSQMKVLIGGEAIFVENLNKQTQHDIYKADFIAIPVALITLILVFGSLVAATIPLILGGGAAICILSALYYFGQSFTLSIFTVNIALMLGLCLTLDYALFIVSRFRDELNKGLDVIEAVAVTQAHAGKAIFFSGIAVFASLSAMLLFPINILFSVAVGGLTAVFFAVLMAVILLPAVLSILGSKINSLSVRFIKKKSNKSSYWRWIAVKVVKRPLLFFLSIFTLLLFLGYPSLFARFGVSDFHILPEHSEYRRVFDVFSKQFNENELSPILLTVEVREGTILSKTNLRKLYDLVATIKKDPLVARVDSIVSTKSSMTKDEYYRLYSMSKSKMPKDVKDLLDTTTRHSFTLVTIVGKYNIHSQQTKTLMSHLRALQSPDFIFGLSGKPISNDDLLKSVSERLPYAIAWILCFTYLILLVLLRSLFLPIKAIIMNILSLSACYGALHLVFQEGYLHQLLNFEPQGMIDISLLVIIFCALFGFSMDYEVFLLSRIKEDHDAGHSNEESIIFGITKSSKIITSAAIIVIFTCVSFLFADVLVVKAFGLGVAVAIFIDAFLIRSLLVPSTMVLVKSWNWYLLKWMDKILPRW